MFSTWYESPVGLILLLSSGKALTGLHFQISANKIIGNSNLDFEAEILPFIQAKSELDEYFYGRRRDFTIPLEIKGTPFQQLVWKSLLEIPYGTTITYKNMATRIARVSSARAVGQANGRNPIPIIIPCHRLIGADGNLTGYGGGISVKADLLRFERSVLEGKAFSFSATE